MRFCITKLTPFMLILVMVLGLASVAASDQPASVQNPQGQPIYARNNTSEPIWVAACYVPPGSNEYFANGFWRVEPGERKLLLYNGNRVYMYFYARNDSRSRVWSGEDRVVTVRGETLNMFRADTGTGYGAWTQSFDP